MTFILNRFVWLGVVAAVLFGTTAAYAQEHIAAVNSDRILRESKPAKAAEEKITNEFAGRNAQIQADAARLKTLADSLDKNGATMSDADRAKLQSRLSQLDIDLQRKRREFNEDLNQRRTEELQSVLESANKAIRKIAEQNKYDLIVQEGVYVNPKIDITDQVLKALASPSGN